MFAKIAKPENGMNILGQGPKIFRKTMPFLLAAIVLHIVFPQQVALPLPRTFSLAMGIVLLACWIALYAASVRQLLAGFPKGKLLTTGAFSISRNPMYASFVLFLIPGVSFLSGTRIYFVVAAILFALVNAGAKEEEKELSRIFGEEYDRYAKSVARVVPFLKI